MSDVTTISNDQGDILQNSCKTSLKKKRVLLCSANAWIRTHAMFQVIPKRCCCFSVVQSFQFEITTLLTYLQGKHSRSVDRKYNYHECWCYIIHIKWFFSAYKSLIVTPCACDLFVSKVTKITRFMDVHFWQSFFSAFFSVWWLYLEINHSLVAEIICTIYPFIHAHTQHNISNKNSFYQCFIFKTVFTNVLFSTEVHNPLHVHLLALSHIYIWLGTTSYMYMTWCTNRGSNFWLSIKSVSNTLSCCCFVCAFIIGQYYSGNNMSSKSGTAGEISFESEKRHEIRPLKTDTLTVSTFSAFIHVHDESEHYLSHQFAQRRYHFTQCI